MTQILNTKHSGPLHLVRSWMGYGQRHIAELVGGGYSRVDGTPVQSVDELTAVIPMPALAKALAWWEHRDDAQPVEPTRAVLFVRGAPCYADTGAELNSLNEVLSAFPDQNPFRDAALTWWQTKATRQHAASQAADLALSSESGLLPQEVPVRKRPALRRSTGRPGSRVEQLYSNDDTVNGS